MLMRVPGSYRRFWGGAFTSDLASLRTKLIGEPVGNPYLPGFEIHPASFLLIGVGPDADRRAKLLIYRVVEGSILGSDSLLVQRSACRGWHSG